MSRKNIILIVVLLVVFISAFEGYKAYNENLHKNDISNLNYSAMRFLSEGGFEALKPFANSILGETFCNVNGYVYLDAATNFALTDRYLITAIFTSTEKSNRCYMLFKIPGKTPEGLPDSRNDALFTLIFQDIERVGNAQYHCDSNNIRVYSDPEEAVDCIYNTIETNAARIESDAVVRKQIDYGILYNIDRNIYSNIYSREYSRIHDYLLAEQRKGTGAYTFDTDPSKQVGARIIDLEPYFNPPSESTTTPVTAAPSSESSNKATSSNEASESGNTIKEEPSEEELDEESKENDEELEDDNNTEDEELDEEEIDDDSLNDENSDEDNDEDSDEDSDDETKDENNDSDEE